MRIRTIKFARGILDISVTVKYRVNDLGKILSNAKSVSETLESLLRMQKNFFSVISVA